MKHFCVLVLSLEYTSWNRFAWHGHACGVEQTPCQPTPRSKRIYICWSSIRLFQFIAIGQSYIGRRLPYDLHRAMPKFMFLPHSPNAAHARDTFISCPRLGVRGTFNNKSTPIVCRRGFCLLYRDYLRGLGYVCPIVYMTPLRLLPARFARE